MFKNKDLAYYKNLKYSVIIEPQDFEGDTFFIAYAKELGKGSCYGEGETPEEALRSFYIEKDIFIEQLHELKKPIPEPFYEEEELLPNGVINVRTSPQIHAKLLSQAKKSGISLNLYLNQILSAASVLEDVNEGIKTVFAELEANMNYNFKKINECIFSYYWASLPEAKFKKSDPDYKFENITWRTELNIISHIGEIENF